MAFVPTREACTTEEELIEHHKSTIIDEEHRPPPPWPPAYPYIEASPWLGGYRDNARMTVQKKITLKEQLMSAVRRWAMPVAIIGSLNVVFALVNLWAAGYNDRISAKLDNRNARETRHFDDWKGSLDVRQAVQYEYFNGYSFNLDKLKAELDVRQEVIDHKEKEEAERAALRKLSVEELKRRAGQ